MKKIQILLTTLILLICCATASAQWATTIGFDEAAWCAAVGGATTTIIDADAGETTFSFAVDVVMPDGTTCLVSGLDNYVEGMDGVDDIMLSITMVNNQDTDSQWGEDHVAFECGNSRFNHEFTISGDNAASSPNDYSYAVFEFTWLNGLCVDIDNTGFRSGSTNGSSEMYETGMFFVNNALPLTNLTNYTNNIYSGCGGVTQSSLGNFLLGNPMVSEGNIAPGVVTDDALNTTVLCPPAAEGAGTNPDAGTGPSNGANACGAADWGMTAGTPVTSFTAILGLQDVAYDTDGNGFSSSNSGPLSRLNEIKIGKACACGFPEPVITLEEDCGTYNIVVGAIVEDGASGTGTVVTYTTAPVDPTYPVVGGTVVTGTDALAADGTSQIWIQICDAGDTSCCSEFGPFTAPIGKTPDCGLFPANPD